MEWPKLNNRLMVLGCLIIPCCLLSLFVHMILDLAFIYVGYLATERTYNITSIALWTFIPMFIFEVPLYAYIDSKGWFNIKCQGWSNYHTWSITSWLDDEQEIYDAAFEIVSGKSTTYATDLHYKMNKVKELFQARNTLKDDEPIFAEWIDSVLSKDVDWREIVEQYFDEDERECEGNLDYLSWSTDHNAKEVECTKQLLNKKNK